MKIITQSLLLPLFKGVTAQRLLLNGSSPYMPYDSWHNGQEDNDVFRRGQLVHCFCEAGIKVYLLYFAYTFLYK